MGIHKSPQNTLIITAASALVGVFYFIYISNVSFPPSITRAVPFVWLVGAIYGLKMGFITLRHTALSLRLLFSVLAIVNILFACIFALAALMGD